MSYRKAFKREVEVAFSKYAQPVWFRVVKYIVLIILLYFYWGNPFFWKIFIVFLVFATALHFWYRYKTKAWTQSYGMWDYERNKPKS